MLNAFAGDIAPGLKEFSAAFPSYELEIGSGNGKFLTEHAVKRPEIGFIGIEYSRKCINKSVSKAEKRALNNIRFIHGEAMRVLAGYLTERYRFSSVYLNFPDPWPKSKHERRRIVTEAFISAVHGILHDGASFYLVTDDERYAVTIMSPLMEASKALFENALAEPWVRELPGYQPTLYEDKMRAAGKEIFYLQYRKRPKN